MTKHMLIRIDFTPECQAQSCWSDWAAHQWLECVIDFYQVASWLDDDRSKAWLVVEDEPHYRRRILDLRKHNDIAAIHVSRLCDPARTSSSQLRSMESAPRDGTPILVMTSDGDVVEAWWDAEVTNFYKSQVGWKSYDPDNMQGDWVSNWIPIGGGAFDGDRRLYCGSTPAFWMPKPEQPVGGTHGDFDTWWWVNKQ